MLSYNTARHDSAAPQAAECQAHRTARRAHAAHALVLGFHSVCCGLPIAATLLASGAVGLVGLAAVEAYAHDLHAQLHQYEGWILAASAVLVLIGGLAEWAARRGGVRRFPAFFAVSVACLAVNAALVVSHRLEHPPVQVAMAGPAVAAPPTTEDAAPAPAPVAHDHDHDHGHDHAH